MGNIALMMLPEILTIGIGAKGLIVVFHDLPPESRLDLEASIPKETAGCQLIGDITERVTGTIIRTVFESLVALAARRPFRAQVYFYNAYPGVAHPSATEVATQG